VPGLQLRSSLVATDFSQASDRPLEQAISLARHYGAKLWVVHVVPSLGFSGDGAVALALATEAAWRDIGKLEQGLSRKGRLKGLDVQFIVARGLVCEEIEYIVRQEHIDVVLIGTHHRKGDERVLFGSVAEQIFRYSSCPVVTIGPHTEIVYEDEGDRTNRSVLFVTDFGGASLKTLPHAITIANRLRKQLVLLHVLSSGPKLGNRWFTADDVAKIRERARVATVERLATLVKQGSGMDKQAAFMVKCDEPSEGILQTAAALQPDMIIMGLKQQSSVEAISRLPWATAYKVMCRAACPVLTMRY
jgi:nucleotide-binding universal stress UspA family protein